MGADFTSLIESVEDAQLTLQTAKLALKGAQQKLARAVRNDPAGASAANAADYLRKPREAKPASAPVKAVASVKK